MPIGSGYAPYIRAASLAGDLPIRIHGLPTNGAFGTEYEVEIELIYHPRLDYSALKTGVLFSLIEGVKAVGCGVISSELFENSQHQ